jgi:type IX secretion system PorP/SprF family membrane protein
MKHFKPIQLLLLLTLAATFTYGQDPSFSQFFSSPLNINPALTARINNKWRLVSNIRDQWISPASPYKTGTISFDTKAFKDKIPESSVFGVGGMMMYDEAMGTVLKSTYASFNLSYNIKLAEGEGDHRLGIGVGLIYGSKHIDFSQLNFAEQFTGYGFDTNLPTGESALSNMKPYISSSVGVLYSYVAQYVDFDFGVSAFHLNKPRQTVLNDPKQYLPPRYVVHANFENYLNERIVLNTNAIYQTQANANYFSVGGGIGYFLSDEGDDDLILNGGLWYWSNNAVIPYFGLVYKQFQFGLSYDVTVSKLASASEKPKTFELSIIIRGDDRPKGVIPCFWK